MGVPNCDSFNPITLFNFLWLLFEVIPGLSPQGVDLYSVPDCQLEHRINIVFLAQFLELKQAHLIVNVWCYDTQLAHSRTAGL